MVLIEYDDMEEVYEEVKRAACGRRACSVMLLVATEVKLPALSDVTELFTELTVYFLLCCLFSLRYTLTHCHRLMLLHLPEL
jgi:hypothetical protein